MSSIIEGLENNVEVECTLPSWLNDEAEKAGLNLSEVLTEALKERVRAGSEPYDYPDDMEKILTYLANHGGVKMSGHEIEKLYRKFSDDWYCAGWMNVSDELLEEFARYLSSQTK